MKQSKYVYINGKGKEYRPVIWSNHKVKSDYSMVLILFIIALFLVAIVNLPTIYNFVMSLSV